MDIAPWLVLLAVVPPFAIFAWYLVRAGRASRYQLITLLVAVAYGMTVETLALHTTHDYDYANLWLMLGSRPDWVPWTIGICWACILYVVMRTSDALGLPWWQRPLYDGASAMTIDLMLDPVMSAARFVPNTVLPCMEEPGALEGGLQLWIWCVPPEFPTPLFLTVPVTNFLGWFAVIATLSFTVRLGARRWRGEERGPAGQVLLLLGMAALAIALDAGVGRIGAWVHGGPTTEWLSLGAVVALPFALVLLQRRTLRFDTPVSLGLLAWPTYAYLSWGSLFFLRRIDARDWPMAALLMAGTIAAGVLMLLMPSLGALRRPRSR